MKPLKYSFPRSFVHSVLLLFAAAVFVSSCKPTGTVSKSPSSKTKTAVRELSEEEKMNLQYIFFNANKEKITGNMDKAEELFAQCIRIDGRNDASMYELAMIYMNKKKFNDALFFARSAVELNPENDWYQLLLAEVYTQTGKLNEAVTVHENLAKQKPERIEYYFNWANALLFAGKLNDAIKVFDMIEQKVGVEKEIIIQKERLYLKLGKTDKAAEEVEKLIASEPSDISNYSLLVELYQANGLKEKVLETIERMKKIKAGSPQVFLALAEYYRSINEKEKSFEQLKLAFSSNELDSDIKLRILTSYLPYVQQDSSMLEQSLQLAKILAETNSNEALSHKVYADFLSVSKKFEEANKQYLLSLSMDNKNQDAWVQLLVNFEELRDWENMLKQSEEALTLFPNNSVLYLFNGEAK